MLLIRFYISLSFLRVLLSIERQLIFHRDFTDNYITHFTKEDLGRLRKLQKVWVFVHVDWCSVYLNEVAHPARAYPGFHGMKRLGIFNYIANLPQHFSSSQASMVPSDTLIWREVPAGFLRTNRKVTKSLTINESILIIMNFSKTLDLSGKIYIWLFGEMKLFLI